MLITITGNVKVSIYGTPKDEIRRQLNGTESVESCCLYLPNDFRDLGIVGGIIRLVLDETSQTFSARTEYRVPEHLDDSDLERLKTLTMGQWSDGLGVGCFEEIGRKLGARIELLPFTQRDKVTIEQLDDGVITQRPADSIYRAARDGDLDAVRRLLESDCDIDLCRDGCSPLICAVLGGFRDVAIELIHRGANVTYFDAYLETDALMATALSNRITDADAAEIASELLTRGVDARSSRGRHSPIGMARNRNKVKLELVLLEHGAEK